MLQSQFSPPDPKKTLQILNIYDGLTIDAECWKSERRYQQERQNLHYRSLHQPGIVCGLGVRLMAETEIPPKAARRDGRWLEIQPGIAIDIDGNPIAIDRPQIYRIQDPTDNADGEAIAVYLYVSYCEPQAIVDPETGEMERFLSSSFEIDQQTQQLREGQVEICRILLQPGDFTLKEPRDIFNPQINELDVCHRLTATWKSHQQVKVALLVESDISELSQLSDRHRQTRENLSCLMKAVESLYPRMQGVSPIDIIRQSVFVEEAGHPAKEIFSQLSTSPERHFNPQELFDRYTLVYLDGSQGDRTLENPEIQLLQSYLERGGMLLVEAKDNDAAILKQLKELVPDLEPSRYGESHPIFNDPFLFSISPEFGNNSSPLELWQLGNIIVAIGQLSAFWGREVNLPRSERRSAHEFGINLLYFARCYWEKVRCLR